MAPSRRKPSTTASTPMKATPVVARRVRRDGAAVRSAILDAAERRLIDGGPAALRLQDVAADAGISHPNVLHHFGSRDGLIHAVITRALDAMNHQLVEAIGRSSGSTDQLAAILDSVFSVMAKGGHGRLIVWLALAGHEIHGSAVPLSAVVDAAHALRKQRWGAKSRAGKQDTAYVVMLAAMTLCSATVQLPSLFRQLGMADDAAASKRFRDWLAKLLFRHMQGNDDGDDRDS